MVGNSAPSDLWKKPQKTGSYNQITPSPKISKQRSNYPSQGEVSPQSMTSEPRTTSEKKHLKLKSKNEFIPQNYQSLPQESYFPSYPDTSQRSEVFIFPVSRSKTYI